MKNTLGVLALLIAGCTLDTGDDITIDNGGDMEHHSKTPDLMAGVGPGHVGGPWLELPPAAAASVSPVGLGPLVKLIQFNADDPMNQDGGQIIGKQPLVITASINVQLAFAPAPATLAPGPFEAVLSWGSGNGAASTAIVDIPVNGTEKHGAILVSVLGTYLEVMARNKSNLLPRATDHILGNPDIAPLPRGGVSIAVGNHPGGPAPVTLTRFAAFDPAGGLAAAAVASVTVPPMARAFTVFRDASQPISIQVATNGQFLDGPYLVAANVVAPRIMLPANANNVNITNTGAAAITSVGVVFELGL